MDELLDILFDSTQRHAMEKQHEKLTEKDYQYRNDQKHEHKHKCLDVVETAPIL